MYTTALWEVPQPTSLQYATMLKLNTTTISTNTVDLVKCTVCSHSVSLEQWSAAAVGQLTLLSALFFQVPRQTHCVFVHIGRLEHLLPVTCNKNAVSTLRTSMSCVLFYLSFLICHVCLHVLGSCYLYHVSCVLYLVSCFMCPLWRSLSEPN